MRLGLNQMTFSVGNADVQIAGTNPRRKALTISAPSMGFLMVMFDGVTNGTNGFPVQSTGNFLRFTVDELGDRITAEVHAQLSVAGPAQIGVLEVTEES
jgi:hypothetical protein